MKSMAFGFWLNTSDPAVLSGSNTLKAILRSRICAGASGRSGGTPSASTAQLATP